MLAPAPTSLPARTGWGASSSLWHLRGWHHPQPMPALGAGDTLGRRSAGGSRAPPAIPITPPGGVCHPRGVTMQWFCQRAQCAAGMLPSHKALRRPAASPRHIPHNCSPPATSRSHLLPRRHKKLLFPPKSWLCRRGGWHTSPRGLGSALLVSREASALCYWALVELCSVLWDIWGHFGVPALSFGASRGHLEVLSPPHGSLVRHW